MRPMERARALQLFAVLAEREPSEQEISRLIDDSAGLKEFRVRLLTDNDFGPSVREVATGWRRAMKRRIEEPDSNELMHAVEKLVERQRAIKVELTSVNEILLRELRALDESCEHMKSLRNKLRQTHAAINECRGAIMQNLAVLAGES